MDNFGFIHGELDTKILILFVLRRLPSPVDAQTLQELCACDTGVGYFDYAQCLAELVETGHVDEVSPERYLITEKGARNGETAESSLPYSVRAKAGRLVTPVAEKMHRDRMICAAHRTEKDGCVVELSLSDGKGEIFSMRLLTPGEKQAKTMERNFRAGAETIYGQIAEILLKD
jgi:predicted transcriptional regulator